MTTMTPSADITNTIEHTADETATYSRGQRAIEPLVFEKSSHGARALTLAQSAERPDIALRKGAPDPGPRVGRVSHVVCRRRLGLAPFKSALYPSEEKANAA